MVTTAGTGSVDSGGHVFKPSILTKKIITKKSMEGPVILHRHIKPIYERLHKAGFKLTLYERSLDHSWDSTEFRSGTITFYVTFGNGEEVDISNCCYFEGDLEYYEVSTNSPSAQSDWFGQNHIYWDDAPPMIWRFYSVDDVVQAMEDRAVEFGK